MSAETAARLVELETQLSYQEDLIQHLNEVVSQQQTQLERLESSMNVLANRLKGVEPDGGSAYGAPEQPPPHY